MSLAVLTDEIQKVKSECTAKAIRNILVVYIPFCLEAERHLEAFCIRLAGFKVTPRQRTREISRASAKFGKGDDLVLCAFTLVRANGQSNL